MSEKKRLADFLDAVALSVASGWGQGEYRDVEGPQCVVGHINSVGGEAGLWDTRDQARNALGAYLGLNNQNLEGWNDASHRRKTHVIAACHAAAQNLRTRVKRSDRAKKVS